MKSIAHAWETGTQPGLKRCPRCGAQVPLARFGRDGSRPDGLCVYCRPCFRELMRPIRARHEERRRVRRRMGGDESGP